MSVVYDGKDLELQRRVAIKTVAILDRTDRETQEQLDRFRQEALAVARLNHRNIVQIYDYGETGDLAYIVMEYVKGCTLRDLMDRQPRLALPDIVRIMQDVLEALEFSHSSGIVHRDIKPANLMLDNTDLASSRIKVADFGIARIESSVLTQTGTSLGTPAYMSPEQVRGAAVDARTDIWSAGVLLYQLLTGRLPFRGDNETIMRQVLSSNPPPPSSLVLQYPAALDEVVKRAMEKNPSDRFRSASEFEAALMNAVSGRISILDRLLRLMHRPERWLRAFSSPDANIELRIAAAIALVAALFVLMRAMTEIKIPPDKSDQNEPPAARTTMPPQQPVPDGIKQKPPDTSRILGMPPPDPPRLPEVFAGLPESQKCAALSGHGEDKVVTVTGIAGPDTKEEISRKAASQGWRGELRWQPEAAENVFCPVLKLLRSGTPRFGEADSGLSLHLEDNRTFLVDRERIRLRVTMPGFSGYLRVDYVAQDLRVRHLYPQGPEFGSIRADDEVLIQAARTVHLGDPDKGILGDPLKGIQRTTAGGPFEQDMIIAIVSSRRLLQQPRPSNVEAFGTYERDLNNAVQDLLQAGGRVAASGMTVQIRQQ
jgi:serine/threonine-protein kinase